MGKHTCLFLALIPAILIPLLGLTWLNFSAFCLLVHYREAFSRWYGNLKLSKELKFLLFALVFGYLVEILAVIDNIPLPPEDRILLNSNPALDLYLALGYYLAFAIVWLLILRRYRFKFWEVFLIAGSFGILFEQTGRIFLSFNPFLWLYVFLVYGSFQASTPVLAREEFSSAKELSVWKKVMVGALGEASAFVLAGVFLWVLSFPIS